MSTHYVWGIYNIQEEVQTTGDGSGSYPQDGVSGSYWYEY